MKLRRQLLLVSLFVLSLPWAGCQYVQEMEKALRDGQVKALSASAHAIAARMASEHAAIDLPPHPAIYNSQQQFYLHPLRSHAIVDGYHQEWLSLGLAGEAYLGPQQDAFSLTAYAGWYQDSIYLFFAVTDSTHDYHNPQQSKAANGDHVVVRALLDKYEIREFTFGSGGTGSVTARYRNEAGQIRQEHRIRGEWRETSNGYEVELGFPAHLAPEGLDFYVVDAGGNQGKTIRLGNQNPIDYPAPQVRPSTELESILAPYADDALRISLVNTHQWLLARAGTLSRPAAKGSDNGKLEQGPESEAKPFLAWLYRLAIGSEDFPALGDARRSGRMATTETDRALRDTMGVGWYQNGNQRVGRVAVPITREGRIIGAVAVEQSTDSLLAETNAAFNSLFIYTLLATGFTGFGLLAYASWLSFRIRRLNRAADNAVGDDGKIKAQFLHSRANDEIGDLTRSYGRLLSRLRDYTEYLRSLSNKLSHELRTPLAVMNSSLENLGHEKLDEGADIYVQRAREASQRLSGILNAMSSASRMEESIQQAQIETFPLDDLLSELTDAYRSTYPKARLELNIDLEKAPFTGSPDLIVQMLDKLVDNALDFCPPEGKITLALSKRKNDYLLSVGNSGPLLPEHMQGQLFDSLVSIRKSQPSDSQTHLGLGLYIVRLIADFHGGQANAHNLSNGSGVSFSVVLPMSLKPSR